MNDFNNSDAKRPNAFQNFRTNHRGAFYGAIAGVAAIVVFGGGALGVAQYQRSVKKDGNTYQNNLVALQRKVGIDLSNCLDKTNIANQVGQEQYKAVKETLQAALSARYTSPDGSPTNADGALKGGSFISALQEQYPKVDTSVWTNVMSVATGCRDDVADDQNHLQAYAAEFKSWTQNGNILNHGIRGGYPNDLLMVKIDPNNLTSPVLSGQQALDYLTRTILTSDAQGAINSGTMPSQNLGGSPAASPSSTR
jgi:hypothetical protein